MAVPALQPLVLVALLTRVAMLLGGAASLSRRPTAALLSATAVALVC